MRYKSLCLYLWSPLWSWLLVASITVLTTCLFALPHNVFASTYGSKTYNNCNYTGQCAPVIRPVTLPDGLKVIINLSDGQIIPKKGFSIIITQLSGSSNASFKSATISIGGKEVQTITPDEMGTARWTWDPQTYPGTQIDIVVTASDGTSSTYHYTVKLASAEVQSMSGFATATLSTSRSGDSWPLAILTAVVPEGVKVAFRNLSPVVVNTFPYALFIILGLVAAAVILQIRRELLASRKITEAVEQEKLMIELKKNFLGLASHYLRTPLTLISSGIDLLASTKKLADGTASQLKTAVGQLSIHVEAIITSNKMPVASVPEPLQPTHGGVSIGIAVAILAVALVTALFNLLAYASGWDLPILNLMTQAASFVFIGLALYQVDRRLTLRRLERKLQNNVLALQQQLQESQDNFLERIATQLYDDYNVINNLASQVPADDITKFLHEGVARLNVVISECRTAQSLKGSRSRQQPVVTDIKSIFDHTNPGLSQLIAAKGLQLVEPDSKQLNLQEPPLIKYVTRSLIDNAVAYSSERGVITLGAHDNGSGLVLAVADQGKGISKDRQQLLFQPLSKIEGFENFDHEGMGFSLYLDKLIMEYLGGSIELQSEENQGTTVNLQLPVASH